MIHVLGAGSIGSLFAAALARQHSVRLLLRPTTYAQYTGLNGSTVRIRAGQGDLLVEREIGAERTDSVSQPIKQLVVAVKAYDVKHALEHVKRHISPATEVLVMHNGMGVRESLLSVWPDAQRRPHLVFGVTSAGCRRAPPLWTFDYALNGVNTVSGRCDLTERLRRETSLFETDIVSAERFEHEQKRKLCVNSVVNPLSTLLQCPNGALLSLDRADLLFRVTSESSRVLGLDAREAFDGVRDVLQRTSTNLSSMLCDVEARRPTEIEFINGHIVREAKRLGLKAPLNSMLQNLVNMRAQQVRHEAEQALPTVR